MQRDPSVHFLSVGASTYQAPETQYDRLLNMVAQSPCAAKFHFLGWQPWEEISNYYRASDIGINVDGLHFETIYGTRTRLVEMLAHDLPVITTEGCELSYLIRDKHAGFTFRVSDWERLADYILRLASMPAQLADMQQAGRELIDSELSFQTTTAPLRAWVKNPLAAPDNSSRHRAWYVKTIQYRLRTMLRMILWRFGLSGRRQ
jgi:glycosyltransferase involved in cell wall biosynthesis